MRYRYVQLPEEPVGEMNCEIENGGDEQYLADREKTSDSERESIESIHM